jgi:hypothetical protein
MRIFRRLFLKLLFKLSGYNVTIVLGLNFKNLNDEDIDVNIEFLGIDNKLGLEVLKQICKDLEKAGDNLTD